jgi:hypothetical protein
LIRKPILNGDILSLYPSKLTQLLAQHVEKKHTARSSASIQEPYPTNFRQLLRLGRRAKHKERGEKRKAKVAFANY